jgi:excisionase family DNA binding protein
MEKLYPLHVTLEDLKRKYGEFMTTKEVANLLKISVEYVRWLCRAGELEAFFISRNNGWRIKTESVYEFLVRRYTLNLDD